MCMCVRACAHACVHVEKIAFVSPVTLHLRMLRKYSSPGQLVNGKPQHNLPLHNILKPQYVFIFLFIF